MNENKVEEWTKRVVEWVRGECPATTYGQYSIWTLADHSGISAFDWFYLFATGLISLSQLDDHDFHLPERASHIDEWGRKWGKEFSWSDKMQITNCIVPSLI